MAIVIENIGPRWAVERVVAFRAHANIATTLAEPGEIAFLCDGGRSRDCLFTPNPARQNQENLAEVAGQTDDVARLTEAPQRRGRSGSHNSACCSAEAPSSTRFCNRPVADNT